MGIVLMVGMRGEFRIPGESFGSNQVSGTLVNQPVNSYFHTVIREMPLHIDVFALFIFLGTVQGIFLSLFFLSKENRSVKSNIFLGLLLIAASLLSIDILLSCSRKICRSRDPVPQSEPLR